MTPRKNIKKKIMGLVSVAVSAALVWWLLSRMDLDAAGALIRQARLGWLVLAAAFTCAVPFCTTLRWLGVLRAQEGIPLKFSVALRAVMMANVLNSFLPSKAGDMAKAVYLRHHGGLARGVGTVILERMVDLSVLGTLGIAGGLVSGVAWGLVVGGALLAIIATVFCVAIFLPFDHWPIPAKIMEKLKSLRSVFRLWVRHPLAMAQTILASLATWSMAGMTIFALLRALDQPLGLGLAYSIFPLAILAGLAPLTVSGIGARDSVLAFLLAGRISLEAATMVGLGYTFFAYWLLSLVSFPAVAWEVIAYLKNKEE